MGANNWMTLSKNRVANNAVWIISAQIVKSVYALIINMVTARYLGPTSYGCISYAASIVAFVAPIMFLGLNGIMVQEIVSHPDKEGETLGTAICMSLISSVFCIAGVALFVSVANPGEMDTLIVCVLYSLLLIFQGMELILYWFQAKLLSKYSSVVSLCSYVVVSGYKIVLLISNGSIYWFALSNTLDYMIISVALLVIYRRVRTQCLSISFSTAKRLFRKSKYYIVSNLMIVVFGQTDRIMLKIMIDDQATGIYSAAAYCAGMTYFVFSAIIDSMRPMIFEAKAKSQADFERHTITMYSIVIYLSLVYSVFVSIFSPMIIRILYGSQYLSAVPVLRIIVWYCTSSYLGGARDVWILAEEKQKYLITLNCVGAFANVVLNYTMIPMWSAEGAAVASLLTQIIVNVVFVSLYKPTRRNGFLMLKACDPRIPLGVLHHICKKNI